MAEPTCRTCYANTLTPDQRQRFYQERVISTVYLCPDHQATEDAFLAKYAHLMVKRSGDGS